MSNCNPEEEVSLNSRGQEKSTALRFLLVTFDFPPSIGGIQTRVANYVNNLVKMGHEVMLVHFVEPEEWRSYFGNHRGYAIRENYREAKVLRLRYDIPNIPRLLLSVVKYIWNSEIDIIHVFSGINLVIGNLFLLSGVLKGYKVGVSLFGKDYLASRPNPIYFIPLIVSLSLAQRIGVNSRATLGLVPSLFRSKGRLLYPGVDVDELRTAAGTQPQSDEAETILFVGRLVRRKGPDILVRAFSMLLKNHPKARLVIVGDGPFAGELEDQVRHLGLKDNVEFTGALRGKELYTRYAQSSIFVMPSRQTATDMEGFGIVFLEAGVFRKPSIGTRTGGIPEAVLDGETGLLVPQGDDSALRDAMDHLLRDKELARKLGERASERAISHFSWEKAAWRLLSMYS